METWDVYDKNGIRTGKTIQRGSELKEGEFHLVVHIWIYNSNRELLIQKRNKPLGKFENIWACTGGSALVGESSIDAAVRETKEETGISLVPRDLKKIRSSVIEDYIEDVWVSKWDGDLDHLVFDKVEVQELTWVQEAELFQMIKDGEFYNYSADYFSQVINNSFK